MDMLYKIKKKKSAFAVPIDTLGYEKNILKMNFNYSGPQKQFVYVLKFPISYKNNQLISQRVSFVNYFDWMGQIREYSLRPIMNKIIKLTKYGKWGLATNSVKLRIFDLLKADDILEVRLWLDKITGRNNIYHLSFDWLRFLKVNSYERVAFSSLIVTCVKIVNPSKAIITKPPIFLRNFFDDMEPKSPKKRSLKTYKIFFSNVNFGKKIKDCSKNDLFIFKNSYQSSLENSNLIGNIYFSNYSKWINSTKDLFLYKSKPDIFEKSHFRGEFVTLECKVSHLQEGMPFDIIDVRMYLSELYERGLILKYEVFKRGNNIRNIKLARVTQTVAFVKYYKSLPRIERIPSEIIRIFLKKYYEF